jgi:GDPmannose 4,6-dehydratase
MLQQDTAEDFVIATGEQYSVRAFIEMAATELGVTLAWEGHGIDEVGTVESVGGEATSHLKRGQAIVKVDGCYFRPAEVESLLGDPTKAKQKLGWEPEITVEQMVQEMVARDLDQAKRHAVLEREGFNVSVSRE